MGEHAFSGQGVPEGFRFQLGAAQDLMPPIALKQTDVAGSTLLEWQALPQARAYFIAGMGARENDEMVIWTSSEQPDIGFGLLDYQTNPAVDRWLKEQVLLAPQTTRCAVPKGVFTGEGAMLRMIAYGNELNLAHPPRPTDPRVPWEPVWAAKVRVKSVTMAMLGMEMPEAEPAAAEAPGRPKPAEETQEAGREGRAAGHLRALKRRRHRPGRVAGRAQAAPGPGSTSTKCHHSFQNSGRRQPVSPGCIMSATRRCAVQLVGHVGDGDLLRLLEQLQPLGPVGQHGHALVDARPAPAGGSARYSGCPPAGRSSA